MFSIDRWIGIAGLVIGLPGFLFLFLTGQQTVALLCLAIFLIIAVSVLLIRRAGNRPPYRMNKVRVDLFIKDTLGEEATIRKEYEVVPSYGHLQEMTHRNIAADGAVVNLRWNDHPIDEAWVKPVLGEYNITARFPGPLPQGKPFSCSLSYDVLNSFLQSEEALVYVADFPAKLVEIVIHFPEGRMCTSATCYRAQGAGKVTLDSPTIDNHSRCISLTLRKPQVGAEFEIWWRW